MYLDASLDVPGSFILIFHNSTFLCFFKASSRSPIKASPFDKIEEATKLAQVYDDIKDMPEGFETIIGEKGVSLSGGQKQRLAMSRAMILDPDILILDDSLSAVDAKTEHAIIDNLKHTRKDKTTIITAHRLSAVVHADLILVMQDGRIIERGRHEDLLAQGGWYAKTYESQQLEMDGGEDDDA